jgi:hypothetical protein
MRRGHDLYPTFVQEGGWYGLLDPSTERPTGKGVAIIAVGEICPKLARKKDWLCQTGAPDDLLQYNGTMMQGSPEGFGDLLYNGRLLYSGVWTNGCCRDTGTVLPGCEALSPRQVNLPLLTFTDLY